MTIDKEMILAAFSFASAVLSGYMLYKSNISKDKTKSHIETLEAEGDFREQLMLENAKTKSDLDRVSEENINLKEKIHTAKIDIKNLELSLSEKIDKCKVIENFLSHLTTPAWVRLIDGRGIFRYAYVNFSFCSYFNVSREYCIGKENHLFIDKEVNNILIDLSNSVLDKKIGIRGKIVANGNVLNVLKFPIIEGGNIIGIGGILIDCSED